MRRKIFAIAVVLCLLCCDSVATAVTDFDLSELSYEELVILRDQINLAMWKCEDWQEVTVPNGVWQVGTDIPEGHWTISVEPNHSAVIDYGDRIDETGTQLSYDAKIYISNYLSNFEDSSDVTQFDIQAKAGCYFVISNGVVFSPYAGKQSLGFTASTKNGVSITDAPQPTEIPPESNDPFSYMRDDSGLLLLNDSVALLFRSSANLESYFTELLTATVDYSLLCIEADGKLNAESMTKFLLKYMDLYNKMSKEPTPKASLSDKEFEAYKNTMNLLLNIATWALQTETWTDEKRTTYVETLSMYLEEVCIPIQ